MITTEELQKLLDGSTSGPWQSGLMGEDGPWCVGPDIAIAKMCAAPGKHNESNARLIALSPELAAEVIRLRAENERLTMNQPLYSRRKIEAENKMLRDALQAIYHGDDSPDGMQGDIARAAIETRENK